MSNNEPNSTFKSSNTPTPNNQIMAIRPYWDTATKCWVFDDAKNGLVAEAFVLGMSEIIDNFLKQNSGVNGLDYDQAYSAGFTMFFSKNEMPDTMLRLNKIKEEYGGCWYEKANAKPPTVEKGWLCAALFHYFDKAPDSIYISAKP